MEEVTRTPLTVRVRILAKVTEERLKKYLCIPGTKKIKRRIKKFAKVTGFNEEEKLALEVLLTKMMMKTTQKI